MIFTAEKLARKWPAEHIDYLCKNYLMRRVGQHITAYDSFRQGVQLAVARILISLTIQPEVEIVFTVLRHEEATECSNTNCNQIVDNLRWGTVQTKRFAAVVRHDSRLHRVD